MYTNCCGNTQVQITNCNLNSEASRANRVEARRVAIFQQTAVNFNNTITMVDV